MTYKPIRFFSSKIRITAAAIPTPAAPKSTTPPTPSGPVFNEHHVKSDNVFHDLETPDMHLFGTAPPTTIKSASEGIRGAAIHHGGKFNKPTGVAKGDANSFLTEPLVYHIAQHIQPGLYPKTAIRNYANYNSGNDLYEDIKTPHSLQEYKPGATVDALEDSDDDEDEECLQRYKLHPHHAAFRALDWAIGNNDRHGNNIIVNNLAHNPDEQIPHPIDSGGAFDYKGIEDGALRRMKEAEHAHFSDEFREGIINADPDYLHGLFQRVAQHPKHVTPRGLDLDDPDNNTDPNNGFLAGNFHRTSPDEAFYHFNNRMAMLKEGMIAGINTPGELSRFLRTHPNYRNVSPSAQGGYDEDDEDWKYGSSAREKGHNNTWGNTHNNDYNNTNNNTYNNTHNNPMNDPDYKVYN